MHLCKLIEDSDVVFDEQTDVSYAVFAHGYAFDAEAEGPAAVLFGVDVAGFEDVGVDHAAAAELDPLLLVFEPDVDLGRGLGEGEETGAEADAGLWAEVAVNELEDG